MDNTRDFRAVGRDVYTIPDKARAEYLNHRSEGWTEVSGSGDTGGGGSPPSGGSAG